jgi:hypothetical protein
MTTWEVGQVTLQLRADDRIPDQYRMAEEREIIKTLKRLESRRTGNHLVQS